MKATVIKVFRNKETGIVNEVGQEVELTKKRYEEINSAVFGPFVEKVKATKEGG